MRFRSKFPVAAPAAAMLFAGTILLCGGCTEAPVAQAQLPTAEIYLWGGQPISISAPPEGWRREKTQQGGLRGARFIKSGSIGEEIRYAEHYALDDRDRCARLEELLKDVETISEREFVQAIHKARLYASPPIHREEADRAEMANNELDRVRMAFLNGDTMEVREGLNDALRYARQIRFSLDDVVERVRFTPAEYDSFGKVEVEPPVEGTVGGELSSSVDFTLDSRDRKVLFHGRQVYVAKNNRLFVLAFLGLPENLPVFERIVASVTFPAGECDHE